MSKHTPGPWELGSGHGGRGLIFPVGLQYPVASTTGFYLADGQGLSNARLIAAAPELLEALGELTKFVATEVLESCNGSKCRERWCAGCCGEEAAEQAANEASRALASARAAIAKARGAA